MSTPGTMTITRVLSPSDWTSKQIDNLVAIGKKNYLLGISKPKKSPIEEGSSDFSEAKFQAQMMIALEKKSRQRGVAASSDSVWYAMSSTLGAKNLVEGVKAREAKVRRFVDAFQPQLLSHLATIDAMPVSTLGERAAKMTANMEGLAALRGGTK